MSISGLFSLLGGLGLFLYGMDKMRKGLEQAAGEKIKKLLDKMTASTMRGFLAGTVVTGAVQSSTAVMVFLVGLVDAGILTLQQTVGVILGANIGTTLTCQLTAFRLNDIAPLMAFSGVILLLFGRKEKWWQAGEILSGFGFLFTGLAMMENAMHPLGEEVWMKNLLLSCQNPLTGIVAGTVFTALLQSSTASVSILQTLARCGLVGMPQSMYIIFGQNIGTCVTALVVSIRTEIGARRTAVLHLLINMIGTIFVLLICQVFPVAVWLEGLTPKEPARQIANFHTAFNVATSLLLLPFTPMLVWLVEWLVPQRRSIK